MAKELKSYGANILIQPASSAVLSLNNENKTALSAQDFLEQKRIT